MKIFLIEVPDEIMAKFGKHDTRGKIFINEQTIKRALTWRYDYDDPEFGFEAAEKVKVKVMELQEIPKGHKRKFKLLLKE